MVEYNVVKYCLRCKKRFVVEKKNRRNIYCPLCRVKVEAEKEAQEDEED
ncbi:MAG: hypothetical protein Q8Q01_04550 [archaeon]|nr:hypothetical protein [archaeon]